MTGERVTDAYDELRKDWCDEGDLPRATCAHCGAHPGGPSLPPLDRPWSFDGHGVVRRSGSKRRTPGRRLVVTPRHNRRTER